MAGFNINVSFRARARFSHRPSPSACGLQRAISRGTQMRRVAFHTSTNEVWNPFFTIRQRTTPSSMALVTEPNGVVTDVGLSLFADDITKHVIPGPGPPPLRMGGEARHLMALARVSSEHLERALAQIG
eukprot:363115-Pyramimonas_sp.AAC.1